MFKSNHFYGHVRVLRAYCGGRLTPPFVPGILQHGWTVGDGVGAHHRDGAWPKFVWSDRNIEHARAHDVEDVRPIGSAFLYLPTPDLRPSKKLVVFPFHGWHQQKVLGDMDAYARRLEALRAEGFTQITVCLYYLDYDDAEIRRLFESRGFQTVTAGPRLANPRFLEKLQRLFLEHEYVSSNRVCTATFYALYLKRKFFLYGPPMGLSRTDDPTGERFDAWQRAEFPRLTWEAFDDVCEEALGRRELGADHKRAPRELADALMWSPAQLPALSRVMTRRARDLGLKALKRARG